jgi:hypothetical protein
VVVSNSGHLIVSLRDYGLIRDYGLMNNLICK